MSSNFSRARGYRALLWFADRNKSSISPTQSSRDLAAELEKQLEFLKLERRVDGEIVAHDGRSLLQWSREMMREYARSRSYALNTLFTNGSASVQPRLLERVGYQSMMSTWNTPFQDDSSEAGELVGHHYPANGLLQNRSNASPSISSFTKCPSPRASSDEMGVDHPSTTSATAAPRECPGSQRSSDEVMENRLRASLAIEQLTECSNSQPPSGEPLADLTSASSGTAAPTGRPNAQHSSIDLTSNAPGARTATPARTESPNAQQPCTQTGMNVPFMGTFSIPDSEVRDKMLRLSQDLDSAVRQLLLSSGIEIGHPAEFEPMPVLELEKLYESALGTKDWRSRAVELQMHGIPRAFDLLIALVGAAVHRWVLDHVHP